MVQGPKDEVRGSARIVNGAERAEKLQCVHCGAPLEEGFLLSRHSPWAGLVPDWIPGQPEHTILGVKRRDRKQRKVSAFRCTKCGRLELYAL